MTEAPTARCDRARARAALAPDGELSLLERRLLDAHLARCEHCRLYAGRIEAVAQELRAAAAACPGVRVAVPRARRRRGRARSGAALVAVAAMALGIAVREPLPSGAAGSGSGPPAASDVDEERALRRLRREALQASLAAPERTVHAFGDRPA